MKKTALTLATLAPIAFASTAARAEDESAGHARRAKGFAAGGQVDSGGNSGLSLKYALENNLSFQGIFGLGMMGESADGAGDDATMLNLTLRVMYNIARANDTNLYAGAGATLGLIDADKTQLDLVLGAEHFFTDHFSVSGHVGLHVDLGDRFSLNLGNVAGWGSAFHFYF
jgi:hypothetical protein